MSFSVLSNQQLKNKAKTSLKPKESKGEQFLDIPN